LIQWRVFKYVYIYIYIYISLALLTHLLRAVITYS
jgi:hypothetical protein